MYIYIIIRIALYLKVSMGLWFYGFNYNILKTKHFIYRMEIKL